MNDDETLDRHADHAALMALFERRATTAAEARLPRLPRARDMNDVLRTAQYGPASAEAAIRIINDPRLMAALKEEWLANPPSTAVRESLRQHPYGFALLTACPGPAGGGEAAAMVQDIEEFLFLHSINEHAHRAVERVERGAPADAPPQEPHQADPVSVREYKGPRCVVSVMRDDAEHDPGLELVLSTRTLHGDLQLVLQLRDGTTLTTATMRVFDDGEPVHFFIQTADALPRDVVHVEIRRA